jgi:tungstate transport system ATP-binding protein
LNMLYDVKGLIKRFDERIILDLKELSIESNKILCLLGPNGAGKTTLMEILAFISSPSEGEIWFKENRICFDRSDLVSIRQRVVLVQQKPILFTTNVFKNLEYPLKIRKVKKKRREDIVNELLGLVGMSDFKEAEAHKLSGGETQRIAIAQALACSPQVILFDEPTSSVDVENQYIIERIIKEINRDKNISVIFTTHDIVQASRIADEIIFLYDGKATDSIHENIFSGKIESEGERKYFILLQGIRINIKTDKSGPARISIDPSLTYFKRKDIEFYPNKNLFTGKLVQLTDQGKRIRALIDIGIPISVLMDYDKFNKIGPKVGEEVCLEIPEDNIEVF